MPTKDEATGTDQSIALIGHTGFVGSNLLKSDTVFTDFYNSKNITDISGREFDLVVCAGVSAVKWKANVEPEADWSSILRLMEPLASVKARRFVLISTTDVYPEPVGVTEKDIPTEAGAQAYGLHRLKLEKFVQDRFDVHHVVRLPALFGPGLKKNAIFDLLTDNQVGRINPDSRFQWYPVRRLASDLEAVIGKETPVFNVACAPVAMRTIVERSFSGAVLGEAAASVGYDMQTDYAELLGGQGRYHLDAVTVLDEIDAYVEGVRTGTGVP